MTREETIDAKLKQAATRAGMIDPDDLAIADLTSIKLTEAGEVEGAEALMAKLRQDKPFLFRQLGGSKHVRDMSREEAAERLAEIKRGPKPEPMPTDKKAKDQTPAERTAWLAEHSRRFG
jgi:hypothetical protein